MSDEYDDYDDRDGPGFFGTIAEFFGIGFGVAKGLTILAIGSTMTCAPAYFAWTTRGDLEKEARKGVIVTPLEYRETFMKFPALGYKIVIENITDDEENLTLAEIVYRQKMLEQQRMAISSTIHLKAQAVQKERETEAAIVEYERVERSKKLVQDVGNALEISEEDREGLANILTGGH